MKRNKTIIIVLLLVLTINIYLMYKSSNNKQITLDNVNLKEEIENMKGIAIMLEQDDGTYIESNTNTFPTDMKFNSELSGCIDNLGNKIEGSLTYENGIANVETNNTSYCYLYFDIDSINKLLESEDVWCSDLENDGCRFIGTDPSNYVCFGYSDSTTDCDFTNAANTDLYAYRIIGIFEDSEEIQHLKLIKKEALNEKYDWQSDNEQVLDWDEGRLYNGLNGSYFLTNTTYSYMQDINWTNKITNWKYIATNTQTYRNYRDNSIYGINYYYNSVQVVYLHEMNRNSKVNQTCYYKSDTIADCSIGEWKIVSSKIGLMYVSDYLLSLGISSLNYTSYANKDKLKTGWIYLGNNDTVTFTSSLYEIGMARYDIDNYLVSNVYGFNGDGRVTDISSNLSGYVRPVFYLTSDVKISGEGTSTNPYIITN